MGLIGSDPIFGHILKQKQGQFKGIDYLMLYELVNTLSY